MLRLKQHKEYNYVVTLRKPSYMLINAISQMMILLAVVVFVYTNIKQKYFDYMLPHLIISVLIVIWWIWWAGCLLLKRVVYLRWVLILAGLGVSIAAFVHIGIVQGEFFSKDAAIFKIIIGSMVIWWIFCLASKRAFYFRLALTLAALGW
ncbi:MAG: hypothetical protein LBE82_03095, partial [Chitinophagaceae bacterium]|nr:hypothetical protein [Chitinophagaceae bacterium]